MAATRATPAASATEATRTAEALLHNAVGGPSAGARRRSRFHSLAVADVRTLTDEAIEVTFAVPDDLVDEYDYLPGQFVALRARVDGEPVRRSYSLCRPPAPGSISIAIKRDRGGRFSTWAHASLRPGDVLDVMSPEGTFTSTLADLDGATVAGIAAGSGITPMMALAAAVLGRSETSRFELVYTNRSTSDVMFVEELADLKDRYPTRFALHHVLSRERRTSPVLSGRIDEPRLRVILERLVIPATVDEWFLCGPMELVQLCRAALEDCGVERRHVRYELFTTGDEPARRGPARPVDPADAGPKTLIEFTLDGQSATVESPEAARESILDAALRVRPDTPFACAGGVCGTCRARLLEGSVNMTENYALEPDELERGYILTCQSHPSTARVRVDYDV
ncbi:1,2-phenylacetyl-CoA epoxidase subunit PaaE [Agromyces sp. MMS24-JH15]|uniref:1,2-phenylacetyl-CoA epoxidase subunit PaaE n=1 Tax=Agromyces sp. MMS24-JH15 TaxID=3243765 RepID=UPI003748C901